MNIGNNSAEQLKSIVERIENIEVRIAEETEARKEVYTEAKSNGYDLKALRAIIRDRKKDADELRTHEELVATYKHALGDLDGTPLGQAAIERAVA